MTIYAPVLDGSQKAFLSCYLDNLALVERLHRLLLDVIKDEFERLNILEINSVQALLLFNVGVELGQLAFIGAALAGLRGLAFCWRRLQLAWPAWAAATRV